MVNRWFAVRVVGVVGLLSVGAVACHAPERIVVSGHSLDPRTYRESTVTVEKMFATDAACPTDPKAETVLSVEQEEVTEIGVSGCNKKRVYLRLKESQSSWGNVRHWSPRWTLKTKSTGEPADF